MSDTPAAPYRIREATSGDIPILVEARRRMFMDMGDAYEGPEYEGLDESLASFLEETGRRQPLGFIAEDDSGAWLGALSVLHERVPPNRRNPSGRQSYVFGLWVRPACRRRGIARSLMQRVIDSAKERGEGAVWLFASDFGRPLYEQLGFRDGPAMRLVFAPLPGVGDC